MSGALRSRVAGASRDDPLDEDASVVLSTEQQEAVVADLEATAGRAASAWRVAVGVLAVTGGAYFAMLAARAAWSGDVDVWRGVRDPKRPTTRRAVASSARLSPPPRLALALPSPLTFPAPSPSPAHPPGCPHRVLRPPRARDIPRAPRAPRRAHRPRAHPRRDRRRVPREIHPRRRRRRPLVIRRRRAPSARRRVRPRRPRRRRRRARLVRRVDARRRPRPRVFPDPDALAPARAPRRAPRVRARVRVARGNRRPGARAQSAHVPTQESVKRIRAPRERTRRTNIASRGVREFEMDRFYVPVCTR